MTAPAKLCPTCGKPAHPKHFMGACGPVATWPGKGPVLEAALVTACHETVTEFRDTWHKPIHGERINQRRADKAGSDKGSPDYLLCVNGWQHPLEFKRCEGGRFSLDQMVAAERRLKAGVVTYAPRRIMDFDRLVSWSERHREGVCPDCPQVPGLEQGSRM